ncbi:hypothetical protein HDU76_002681 [Blyttiomyces sp. JEL0837]|nr:hypothetical protein HDU76_002681 [Blyttiomyces sp. JEL0837]
MGKNNKTCYTTRSFEVVGQNPSEGVISTYLLSADGTIAQNNAANLASLTNTDTGKPPAVLKNGGDQRLLNDIIHPALGCNNFMAPDLVNPSQRIGSLALNEIQAAALQANPIALVPATDPSVMFNGSEGIFSPSLVKQNTYRLVVGQPVIQSQVQALDYAKVFCGNLLGIGITSLIRDIPFTFGLQSPADTAADLFTFLASRFHNSWIGLACDKLLSKPSPMDVSYGSNINGVASEVCFDTEELRSLIESIRGP